MSVISKVAKIQLGFKSKRKEKDEAKKTTANDCHFLACAIMLKVYDKLLYV